MEARARTPAQPVVLGRYVLYDDIASGGTATLHLGRLQAPGGFARTVAIKRLHPHLAREGAFVEMFLDEARLASRVRHANVVATLDVVHEGDESFLVMEYVHGATLWRLMRAAPQHRVPVAIAKAIAVDVLHGLHAAHEARDEAGHALELVHRDVSPQNVLVGIDGAARVLDFGVAKALGRLHVTRDGSIKGKLPYMAPEQLAGGAIDRRIDVWAAGVVLWEMLAGERLFHAETDAQTLRRVLNDPIDPPSTIDPRSDAALDAIVLGALEREPDARTKTAREMAEAIERTGGLASASEVAAWVDSLDGATLAARAGRIAEIERAAPPARPSLPSAPPREQPPAPPKPSLPDASPTAHTAVAPLAPPRSRRAWLLALPLGAIVALATSRYPAWTSASTLAAPSAQSLATNASVAMVASAATASIAPLSTASAPALDSAEPSASIARAPSASPPRGRRPPSLAPSAAPQPASSGCKVVPYTEDGILKFDRVVCKP